MGDILAPASPPAPLFSGRDKVTQRIGNQEKADFKLFSECGKKKRKKEKKEKIEIGSFLIFDKN